MVIWRRMTRATIGVALMTEIDIAPIIGGMAVGALRVEMLIRRRVTGATIIKAIVTEGVIEPIYGAGVTIGTLPAVMVFRRGVARLAVHKVAVVYLLHNPVAGVVTV